MPSDIVRCICVLRNYVMVGGGEANGSGPFIVRIGDWEQLRKGDVVLPKTPGGHMAVLFGAAERPTARSSLLLK